MIESKWWTPLGVAMLLGLAGTAHADDYPHAVYDSDQDGIPDHIELESGTSPLHADTDGDGVPDGIEDINQDGVLDPGETDPRRPGLFPGSAPHIPEPMHFDLVRGLGAHKGELEVNVLMSLSRPSDRYQFDWAPEVEWAIVDGFAVELELPMQDREVVAFKGALQWTAPSLAPSLAHGVQLIGEYLIDDALTEVSGLYLFGGRIGKMSLFSMLGARAGVGHEDVHVVGLINPSVFYDLGEAVTLGLESNVVWDKPGQHSATLLGQVHWQVSRVFRVQAGGGAELTAGGALPMAVMRLILE